MVKVEVDEGPLHSAKPDKSMLPLMGKHRHYLRIVQNIAFAATICYMVFWHDFGDHDHCFVPPRQFVARQKAAFLALSDKDAATAQHLLGRQQEQVAASPDSNSAKKV